MKLLKVILLIVISLIVAWVLFVILRPVQTTITYRQTSSIKPAKRHLDPEYIKCYKDRPGAPTQDYIDKRIEQGDPLEDFIAPSFYTPFGTRGNYYCLSAQQDKWLALGPHGEWLERVEAHIRRKEIISLYEAGKATKEQIFELATLSNHQGLGNQPRYSRQTWIKQAKLFYEAAQLGHPNAKLIKFTEDRSRNIHVEEQTIQLVKKTPTGVEKVGEVVTGKLNKSRQYLAACYEKNKPQKCTLIEFMNYPEPTMYQLSIVADTCDQSIEACWGE